MNFAQLFSSLTASLDGDDVPPIPKRPAGKSKFVKFRAGDTGEGMPEVFFEGGWILCLRKNLKDLKYIPAKILERSCQNRGPSGRFRRGVYFQYVIASQCESYGT